MNVEFVNAAKELLEVNARYIAGQIKPVQLGQMRGEVLAKALQALAGECGVQLQAPLHIDSRGEFNIVALPQNGMSPQYGAGQFGDRFIQLLNSYSPRTGVYGVATLLPDNGWCYMNHIDVEKMVLERHAKLVEVKVKPAASSSFEM